MSIRRPWLSGGGLGMAAIAYVGIDYIRHVSTVWHAWLQPTLWSLLALAAVIRVPFYKHWPEEFSAVIPFVTSIILMLTSLVFEALCVRFVSAVLGLDWHSDAPPLPDTGQWLLLALNEKLPQPVVTVLRARVIGLHHFLMLFMMLAFSVLFGSIKAPGLGLGARYMFTMTLGRILRSISFVSTILPSARPWCASVRYTIPNHPHHWAQKYYSPYASDANAIRQLLYLDTVGDVEKNMYEYRPDWGFMSFLIDFLRPAPSEGSSWYGLLKKAEGGCNDLLFSGHLLVAVLTAMAWTESYGGFSSALIWFFVVHSAQREIRERHHYTVDCVVAIYVGILLWKMTTGFLWPIKDKSRITRLSKLEKIQSKLIQAAKDSDVDGVREVLKEVELESLSPNQGVPSKGMWFFACVTILFALVVVVLSFVLTSGG